MTTATRDTHGAADTLPELDRDEIRRYGRHLVLEDVGVEGQRRLKAGRVLLVGAGGLGSPASLYLAAAGVGTIGLVDFDRVDVTNLQRQVLYAQGDVGRPKVEAAAERLRGVNPHVEIVPHDERLQAANVRRLIRGYDMVVDGSDNFPTRYLVNDACLLEGKPNMWGAVLRFEGQASVFCTPDGPCYRCLFPEPPPPGTVPNCAQAGVLGVLPGIIGGIQANEAIKWILGRGDSLVGRFLVYDALGARFREMKLPKDPACPACSDGAEIELVDLEPVCEVTDDPLPRDETTGGDAADAGKSPVAPPADARPAEAPPAEVPPEIDVGQLAAWREAGVDHWLLDVREETEYEICRIEGAELVPLRTLPARLEDLELEPDDLAVVYCHVGGRSAHAVRFLRSHGFHRATNLGGGIDEWSRKIDPDVPRY